MDGAAAVLPAHRLLREQTRDAHDAAEASAGMRALLGGTLGEAGYRELLAAQLALYRAWEAERADELAAVAGAWAYQSRVPSLVADLAAGGLPVGARLRAMGPAEEPSRASALLHGGAAPSASVEPAFWGELYVVEGSTLGGQVIVRYLRERSPSLPHAFYAMGERAPGQWRHFQQALDAALPGAATQTLAIAGARRMFARFQRTLEDPGHHD
jgi:heme oxygenase (biliverdin-IX-beta and delta-forming)